jgi:lysophospholipase L1-like esterase
VINAGVLGHTSSEGLVQLLVQLPALEPDVVLLRFGNNDHAIAMPGDRTPMATRAESFVLRAVPPIVWRSAVARLVAEGYRTAIAAWRPSPRPVRLDLAAFRWNLERFVEVARAEGVHLAFLDFPYREPERGPSPNQTFPDAMMAVHSLDELYDLHRRYQEEEQAVARETETPWIATEPAVRHVGRAAFSDWDMTHPTPVGARAIAEAVVDALEPLGWLDAPARR